MPQVGRGVHVRAQAGHVGQQDLDRPARAVPAGRASAEPGPERRPGPRGVQRGAGARGVRDERLRPAGRGAQPPVQLRGPQRGQVRGQPGRARPGPAGGGQRRAVGQRRVQPGGGLVRHDHRAQLTQRARGGRVVGHHEHGRHHRAGGRRAHRVRRHGQRELLPGRSSQAGQPGFGAGKYLDGDHQRPAERALGHTGDHTVPAAGRAGRWLRRVMAMPRHGDGRNGRLAAMRNLLSAGGRAHR